MTCRLPSALAWVGKYLTCWQRWLWPTVTVNDCHLTGDWPLTVQHCKFSVLLTLLRYVRGGLAAKACWVTGSACSLFFSTCVFFSFQILMSPYPTRVRCFGALRRCLRLKQLIQNNNYTIYIYKKIKSSWQCCLTSRHMQRGSAGTAPGQHHDFKFVTKVLMRVQLDSWSSGNSKAEFRLDGTIVM
jgi:hypothetical protein